LGTAGQSWGNQITLDKGKSLGGANGKKGHRRGNLKWRKTPYSSQEKGGRLLRKKERPNPDWPKKMSRGFEKKRGGGLDFKEANLDPGKKNGPVAKRKLGPAGGRTQRADPSRRPMRGEKCSSKKRKKPPKGEKNRHRPR